MKRKITWLASYPKSGNTWLRALLTAYLNTERNKFNINKLIGDINFPSKDHFDSITSSESQYLYPEEIESYRKEILLYKISQSHKNRYLIGKIHDKYSKYIKNIISSENTKSIIYIARNPLDIVASFAHHINDTYDEVIRILNDETSCLATKINHNQSRRQFQQLLGTWSQHVCSWTEQNEIPVYLIKYEDLKLNPMRILNEVIHFLEVEWNADKGVRSLEACSFEQLQTLESAFGFSEKSRAATSFFRKGVSGGWRNELTNNQVQQVKAKHYETMHRLNYID